MKTTTKRKLLSIFFPERCPYCTDVVKPCEVACEECKSNFPKHGFKKQIAGIYETLSALPYDDNFKDAILRLKFGKETQYAYQLAKIMSEKLTNEKAPLTFDVITFVPLHPETFKERGFNQSELLAESISEILGIPCEALLKKTRKNKPQHKLTADKKQKNVKGVYRPTDKNLIKGRKILLIDDIVTTGFTLAECAKILDENDADDIYCMTFAISLSKTT